jgi:hypothetical protein
MSTDNIVAAVADFGEDDMVQLRRNLAELSSAVEQRLPQVRTCLSMIMTALQSDPAVVTLLEPHEVRGIISGLAQDVGIVIEEKEKAKAKAGKKKTHNIDEL